MRVAINVTRELSAANRAVVAISVRMVESGRTRVATVLIGPAGAGALGACLRDAADAADDVEREFLLRGALQVSETETAR